MTSKTINFPPTCATCKFSSEESMVYEDRPRTWLVCRRYPPQYTDEISMWPTVDGEDWCGEYRVGI